MKCIKRTLLIVSILILCLFTTWFIFKKFYLTDMVHTRIEKSIEENIENDFEFTFEDFKINWFSQNLELKGFNLSLFDDIDTVSFFTGNLTIHIRGWRNIIFDNTKIIETIVLQNADIYYSLDHPVKIKNKNEKKDQKLEISNVRAFGKLMITEKHEQQSGELSSYFNLTVPLNFESELGMSIDKVINKITHCEVSDIHYFLPDGFYQLKVKKLLFSDFKDIMLNQIVVTPVDSRKIFAKKKKLATDYVSVAVDSIQLSNFNSEVNKKIYLDKISIFQPSIDVYKDKNYPENPEFKPILVDLLQELKTSVYVKHLEVNNMFIKYSQLANQSTVAGNFYFSNAHATISNITNIEDSLKVSKNLFIEANAQFYGKGKLETTMKYDMLSKSGQFDVQGNLGSMDIVKVNNIISELVPVKVKSGQLESLRFSFAGSRNHSNGEMWFKYSNLKIQLLEVEYLNSDFAQNVVSSIGNMVLRNSNPSDNGTFKIGDIDQDRITNKSIFNYWWVSLQSGFLSTLGVTADKQKIKYQSGESATFSDKIEMSEK